MSLLIQYLVKLSISLAVVWLFYQFILRRLTFYTSNRWYLLAYTLLSFLIPFVNISSILENKPTDIIQMVPSVHQYTVALEEASHCPIPLWSTQFDKWDFIAFGMMAVASILLLRFMIRYFSFIRIQRKAKLISGDSVKIYQVDDNIIPFSFGNSIFINSSLHTAAELEEIVSHEFVHVRQRHTVDIVWAEMLCIINWYNPFAWLLKRSIRQNLEFIADNKVIENGINKKQYQYLLLKVIGNNQFSIATQFNFSSLKKRIVMMNKTKSARRQLGRFLFLVPVLAIILISFRKSLSTTPSQNVTSAVSVNDTIPANKRSLNNKGNYVDIVDENGDCTVVVKDKNNKEIKRLLLTEWKSKKDHYEDLYGEISLTFADVAIAMNAMKQKNPDIKTVTVKGDIATITLKNGKTETYTLSLNSDKRAFEERCGIKEEPVAAAVAVESEIADVAPVNEVNVVNETIADNFEITDTKAVMHLRNGKTEVYNLTDPKERAAFENKFGKIIRPSISKTAIVSSTISPAELSERPLTTTVAISPAEISERPLTNTVALSPLKEVTVITDQGEVLATDEATAVIIEPEILLTITQKTTREELESFKKILKEKGFELQYDEPEFRNGVLVKISGTIKSKDGQANFVGVDFNKLIISQVKKGEKVLFRIDEVVKKRTAS